MQKVYFTIRNCYNGAKCTAIVPTRTTRNDINVILVRMRLRAFDFCRTRADCIRAIAFW